MSQEVYFGEVEVRRFDRFEAVLDRIASKLEESAPSASTNTATDAMQRLVRLVDSCESTDDFRNRAFVIINSYRAAQHP